VLSPQVAAVPEPSSLLLMAAGLAAAGAFPRNAAPPSAAADQASISFGSQA
jgi:hypothetical protein